MSSEILRSGSVVFQPFPWRHVAGASNSSIETDAKPRAAQATQRGAEEAFLRQLEQARQQGHREAQSEAAQSASARVDALLGKLAKSIEDVVSLRARVRREAEEDVVKLSLAIAKKVVGRELSVDPDIILALVKAGLQKLDARDIHTVRTHPEDAARIKSFLDASNLPARIEVSADSSLERGSVLFTTARGTVDLSVNTQLAEIERGFTDLLRRRG